MNSNKKLSKNLSKCIKIFQFKEKVTKEQNYI